jgi:hypothetical protein
MSTPPYPLPCSGGGTLSMFDQKCRIGETQNTTPSGGCPPGLERYRGTPFCGKLLEPCPSGSTLTTLHAKDDGPQPLCIPNSAQLGPWVDVPSDIETNWPCQGTDFVEANRDNKYRCVFPPGGTGSTTTTPTGAETTSSSPASVMAEVNQSLRPFRPPTAPNDDLERERKAIMTPSKNEFLLIQISLFIVFLVFVVYVVVPGSWAHTIALSLVVVGIAIGFFLPK